MDKLHRLLFTLIFSISFMSVYAEQPIKKITLNTKNDSLNYAYGVANGFGIKQYVIGKDTDGTKTKAYEKGFNESFKKISQTEILYYKGETIANQINENLKNGFLFNDSAAIIDKKMINDNLFTALKGKKTTMNEETCRTFFSVITRNIDKKPHQIFSPKQLDSLNISFGILNGLGIRESVLGADTSKAQINQFLNGYNKCLKQSERTNPIYYKGIEIGMGMYSQLTNSGLTGDSSIAANTEIIKEALLQAITGESTLMTRDEAQTYFENYMNQQREEQINETYGANKKAGEDFLTANSKKDSIITTLSGLQYKILKQGKGPKPNKSDKIKVNYTGKLIDGTIFDTNARQGTPIELKVNQVIPGWQEALQLMPVGSKYEIYVPYNLAYGDRDLDIVKPYSALIFDIELLDIIK